MPLLRVEKLRKSFGELVAVKDLSFDVNKGEILGLIGPNGAGKTTTFNCITGHLKPDHGVIEFEGKNIAGLSPHKICKLGIARTFQIARYFPNLTVFDHVLTGAISRYGIGSNRDELAEKVIDVLDYVGLKEKKDIVVRNLTIPDKKRVCLATALVLEPKLLLLDEAMAGLNPTEVDEYVHMLKKLNEEKGITMIVVEHVMRAVMKLSDRIVVMHYGSKIAEGTPEEVSENKKVIEAYLGEKI